MHNLRGPDGTCKPVFAMQHNPRRITGAWPAGDGGCRAPLRGLRNRPKPWFLAGMHRRVVATLLLIAASLLASPPAEAGGKRGDAARKATVRQAATPEPSLGPCLDAIRVAAREHRLPDGLLEAIARTESGRADPRTGRFAPWPWTINAEGQGQYFETKDQAIAAVQALRARGVTVIDAGCMQVNLHHHPDAFPTLEHAFDPGANARYAALFLKRLNATRNDWELSAAHYHSTTPERAEAYRLKVLANWPQMAGRLTEEQRISALAGAWAASSGTIRPSAFGPRALVMTQQPMLHGRASPLLEPIPPIRVVARSATTGRPVYRIELAEAPLIGGALARSGTRR